MSSGETGTGKTHTARLIHDLSPRASKPFVAVNCAELTASIIEAELFGFEKGVFTGAFAAKEGKFESGSGRNSIPGRDRRVGRQSVGLNC